MKRAARSSTARARIEVGTLASGEQRFRLEVEDSGKFWAVLPRLPPDEGSHAR